jgi:hypothetical protein
VGLDSLDLAAFQLVRAGLDLSEVLARMLLLAGDVELLASVAASPVTGAQAEVALAFAVGPGGLTGQLTVMGELATATSLASAAYREAERQVALSLDAVHDTVMFELGANAPALAVGAFTAHALGADLRGLGIRADRAVYEHPELADLGGGVAGLTAGLRINPLTAPLLAPGDVRPSSGSDPAEPYDASLRVLGDSAEWWGLLSDAGRARVLPEPIPRSGSAAPTSVAELARGQLNLSDADDYPGHVRVIEVPQPGGGSAWIVEISGTQVWDPRAGSNPHDVTTDVRLMARESTVLAAGVEQALHQAQAASGRDASHDPVLLSGHSLGGIVAAGLASSPSFVAQHRVTHVVTMGSPVARMPVPRDVQVLSLEHHQDPVPRLEGRLNPDRRSWVTVTRDLHGDSHAVHTGTGAHATEEYAETAAAVDSSSDPSIRDWRQGSRQFFEARPGASPVVRDYRIERIVPER